MNIVSYCLLFYSQSEQSQNPTLAKSPFASSLGSYKQLPNEAASISGPYMRDGEKGTEELNSQLNDLKR